MSAALLCHVLRTAAVCGRSALKSVEVKWGQHQHVSTCVNICPTQPTLAMACNGNVFGPKPYKKLVAHAFGLAQSLALPDDSGRLSWNIDWSAMRIFRPDKGTGTVWNHFTAVDPIIPPPHTQPYAVDAGSFMGWRDPRLSLGCIFGQDLTSPSRVGRTVDVWSRHSCWVLGYSDLTRYSDYFALLLSKAQSERDGKRMKKMGRGPRFFCQSPRCSSQLQYITGTTTLRPNCGRMWTRASQICRICRSQRARPPRSLSRQLCTRHKLAMLSMFVNERLVSINHPTQPPIFPSVDEIACA